MDAARLKDLLAKNELSVNAYGRLFGVNERMARRSASGEWAIPLSVAIALELMDRYGVTPEDAYRLATGEEFKR